MSKLGKGSIEPAKSFKNSEILSKIGAYKKIVTNSYTLISGDEIPAKLNFALHISPKIDGEPWFLLNDGEWKLVSSSGKVISGEIEILKEASDANLSQTAIYGGELHVLDDKRTRIADLASLLGKADKAKTETLGFAIWDMVFDTDISAIGTNYSVRLDLINKIKQGKNLFTVETIATKNSNEVEEYYSSKVLKGELEGLICRAEDGRTFKVKPLKELDMAILGYTERRLADGSIGVRSLLFGLQQEDGCWIPISTTGNVGDEETRRQIHQQISKQTKKSDYRLTSRSSALLYQMVSPTIAATVQCLDIQVVDTEGKSILDPKLTFDNSWKVTGQTVSASIHNAILQNLRSDKTPGFEDTGWNQITRILPILELTESKSFGKSEIIRRSVWTKGTAEKTDVRKLVVWKTNKQGGEYPAFVVHWTDFSSTRKSPLDREVRLAPTENVAMAIAEDMISENIKKGWELIS